MWNKYLWLWNLEWAFQFQHTKTEKQPNLVGKSKRWPNLVTIKFGFIPDADVIYTIHFCQAITPDHKQTFHSLMMALCMEGFIVEVNLHSFVLEYSRQWCGERHDLIKSNVTCMVDSKNCSIYKAIWTGIFNFLNCISNQFIPSLKQTSMKFKQCYKDIISLKKYNFHLGTYIWK